MDFVPSDLTKRGRQSQFCIAWQRGLVWRGVSVSALGRGLCSHHGDGLLRAHSWALLGCTSQPVTGLVLHKFTERNFCLLSNFLFRPMPQLILARWKHPEPEICTFYVLLPHQMTLHGCVTRREEKECRIWGKYTFYKSSQAAHYFYPTCN